MDDEIFYDFQLNTTESVVDGRDRGGFGENLNRIWAPIQSIWQTKARRYQSTRLWNYAGMEKIAKTQRYII